MASKLLTLEAWAEHHFGVPPHPNTLRKWARDGFIQPAPKKVGRGYLVDENAVYDDYRSSRSLINRMR